MTLAGLHKATLRIPGSARLSPSGRTATVGICTRYWKFVNHPHTSSPTPSRWPTKCSIPALPASPTMVNEGLINLDFADVRAVMREMGSAMMGTGEASGDKRVALRRRLSQSMDHVSLRGAHEC